jgi:hypothetical protein
MKFRTEVEIQKSSYAISQQQKLLVMGSCFSENIGNKLRSLKFQVDLNPFGVIFNPASIAQGMDILLEKRTISDEDLFFNHDCWNSFMHHSRFSKASKEDTLVAINSQILQSSEKLHQTDYFIFTFGTAWIYMHKDKKMTVANCHKLPANVFERKLLSVEEIIFTYKALMQKILQRKPNANFIYTISPVRHLKDTAHGNQLSKSILHLAVHELLKEKNTGYFPAYEIMLDELRDYRFYDDDMVHPSALAIDYIFEKFADTYFSKDTIDLNEKINEVRLACQHRPVNPKSESHQKFVAQILGKITNLEKHFPYLNFDEEKRLLEFKHN